MKSKPVFISVLYRSGSTLLALILDQSQELKMSYDAVHFMRFSHGTYLPIENHYKQLVYDTHKRINERTGKKLAVNVVINNIQQNPRISEAIVYDEIMKSFLQISGDERWGDRSAVNWSGIPSFIDMFPDGKVIHIYRDPRAVLASYKYFTYHEEPMYMDAVFASSAMFNFIENKAILQNKNIYLLKYEDLVSKPVETIKDICQFLDISYTSKMLNAASFIEPTGKTFDSNSSFKKNRKTIDRSSIDVWRDKLSNLDIYITEMVLKEKLLRYGYKLSGIDLNKNELTEMYDLLHIPFLRKRYKYWLENGTGLEAYPDTIGVYDD